MRDHGREIAALESLGDVFGYDPDYIRNTIDFTTTMQRAWDEAEPEGREILTHATAHMMQTEYKPPEVKPDEGS